MSTASARKAAASVAKASGSKSSKGSRPTTQSLVSSAYARRIAKINSGESVQGRNKEEREALQNAIAKSNPDHDKALPDFDVIVPYRSSGNVSTKWAAVKNNIRNELKSAFSLFTMLQVPGSLPENVLPDPGFWSYFKYPRILLSTRSESPSAPLAGFRNQITESYIKLLEATFQKDAHTASDYSSSTYRSSILDQIEKSKQRKDVQTFWTFEGIVNETRILSIRTTVNPFVTKDKGNPLIAQALVRLDTMQSVERYSSAGAPLHQIPSSHPFSDPAALQAHLKSTSSDLSKRERIPAVPRRVVEYLVLERKFWLTPHWRVRKRVTLDPQYQVKEERYSPALVRGWRDIRQNGLMPEVKSTSIALVQPRTYANFAITVKDNTIMTWWGVKEAWKLGRELPLTEWYEKVRIQYNPRYLEQKMEKKRRREERWGWLTRMFKR